MIYNPQLEGDPFLWEGGPTGVLLIHGYTATTAEVRPLAGILHQQGYTVAGPLLPGHNTRPEDANRYRWRDWVRAVEESYRQLAAHCQRVIIGGESMGALLALYLASEHPEVAAILAYAPALKLKNGPAADDSHPRAGALRALHPQARDGRRPVLAGVHGLSAEGRSRAPAPATAGARPSRAYQPAHPDRAGPAGCDRRSGRGGDHSPRSALGGQGIPLAAQLAALRHHRPGARAGEPAHAGLPPARGA